jgi:glutamyl-tRNA reductase
MAGIVYSKLSRATLSGEQAEAVEHLSRSLVNELIHGLITKVIDTVEESSNSVTGGQT